MQKESLINICDNTSARWLKIFQVYRNGRGYRGGVGYIFFGAVRKVRTFKIKKANVLILKKGYKVQGQIVRLRRWTRRKDGQQLRCEDNSGILIRARLTLRGAYMVGPIIRDAGRHKILVECAEVI